MYTSNYKHVSCPAHILFRFEYCTQGIFYLDVLILPWSIFRKYKAGWIQNIIIYNKNCKNVCVKIFKTGQIFMWVESGEYN